MYVGARSSQITKLGPRKRVLLKLAMQHKPIRVYTEAEVLAFEETIGARLPEAFRAEVQSLGIDPGRFDFLFEEMLGRPGHEAAAMRLIRAKFPYQVAPKCPAPIDPEDPNQYDVPGALLQADGGCGSLVWLVIEGPLRGYVVLTDCNEMLSCCLPK
jgi:hypothetical protein